MSYQSEVDRLNKKIDETSEKLRQAFKQGKSMTRRANLRAELDDMCRERDFYKQKIKEEGKQ